MSGDHDPTAADVIEAAFFSGLPDTGLESALDLLATLSAAGLSVVRTGEVPAWMEQANCATCGEGDGVVATDEAPPWIDDALPIYVLRPKENQ